MKRYTYLSFAALLLLVACGRGTGKVVDTPPEDLAEIPPEVASGELEQVLPNSAYLISWSPVAKLTPALISSWDINELRVVVSSARLRAPVQILFSDVQRTILGTMKGHYIITIYTGAMRGRHQFQIWFKAEADAKTARDMIEALRLNTGS